MKQIAWIGVGVMGSSMAGHLIKAGYVVRAYNRTWSKTQALQEELGAVACESIEEAVRGADIVFTMVGYPKDVEEVYLGKGGIFESADSGTICIDMTTSFPSLAVTLAEQGLERGLKVLDAPVSGGDIGARNATLAIMVGGDADAFTQVEPMLALLGRHITHMGTAGSGQHTKAANQIAVAGATAAMTEAIVYAQGVGLDPQLMLTAIGGGAAGSWQIANMAPRVLKGDFAPGFYVKHFIKDMEIIACEAQARGIQLEMLPSVLALYHELDSRGFGNLGTQSLIKRYTE
jgi:3-hydroxyisobutyrate dehydrogenase-like beta-hydroxyacid dehydrogenase